MNNYHLNFFRPYQYDSRNEMSVTRALMITCAKSQYGKDLLNQILDRAGICDSIGDMKPEIGLEVPGDPEWIGKKYLKKFVLCISPEKNLIKDGLLSPFYSFSYSTLENFSNIVPLSSDNPDLEKLKKKLIEMYPSTNDKLLEKDETETEYLLRDAYWDIWRLLYAGARVDALIQTDDMLCLVESKIWGGVYEVQAHNHSQEFFGTIHIPVYALTWQTIYDIAKAYNDPIMIDFTEYLSEFPQLVRWNGFDALDIAAFAMDEDALNAESPLQNRLSARYWQCMEELCKRFDYKILASRSEDWDFTPKGFNIIGNTGIGFWGCENLTAKWCVGYHAWEMDTLMAKQDLKEKGEKACEQLAADLTESRIAQGLKIGIRAVQRFQYANAKDGTWFGENYCSIADTQNAADTLKFIWNQELVILNRFHNRRGLEVTSAEALEIKRDIFKIREPHNSELPFEMKTKHKTWKLFGALDVFVHINPDIFSKGTKGAFMTKEEQLDEMDKIIRSLTRFAEKISI